MHRGYVRLWRRSMDAGWLKNHKLWVFWSWCLMRAAHKERDQVIGYQTIHLLPGQFVFGRIAAAEELCMTERAIRTNLKFLKNSGNVTIKTTNKFSIISIINWETYQQPENPNDQQPDQPVTSKRPASDHKQECKECKECKEERGQNKFAPPTLQEVLTYCKQRNNKINAQTFINFYTSKNWMIGKNKMKDWKAAVRTWEQKERSNNSNGTYRKFGQQSDRPLDAGTAEDAERVAAEWNKAQAAANDNAKRNALGDYE